MTVDHLISRLSSIPGAALTKIDGSNANGIDTACIAAAMPKDWLTSRLLRVKYCGEPIGIKILEKFADKVWSPSWTTKTNGDQAGAFINLVLAEWARNSACPSCRGTAHVRNGRTGNTFRICPRCKGSGRENRISGREISRRIGINEKSFRETWKKRWVLIEDHLNTLESSGLKELKSNLGI